MSESIDDFADALERAPQKVSRQLRGIMAKHLDRAAGRAQQDYLASRSAVGPSASVGTVRARMSATVGSRGGQRQAGYLLADGRGVFFNEHGGRHTPPNPVVRRAIEAVPDAMRDEVLSIMVDP